MEKKIERRSFLKGMALTGLSVAGMGVLEGCSPKAAAVSTIPSKWDKEADVVIVGGGGTGLAAAVEAVEKGAKVIVVEKAAAYGGSTASSSGIVLAAGTQAQKEMTTFKNDTPDKLYGFWKYASEGIADDTLVKAMADGALDCVNWLEAHGIKMVQVYPSGRVPGVPEEDIATRIHVNTDGPVTGGKFHVDSLHKAAADKGVEFLLESPVNKLIFDPQKGVVGIEATSAGKTINIKAKKAVILASGGYDRNKEMAKTFSPHQLWALETGVCYTALTNTGDGIRMAMDIGADLAAIGGFIGMPSTNVGMTPTLPGQPEVPGIIVNKYGLRFVAESNHYAYVMRATFAQEGKIAWTIWDQKTMDLGGELVSGISYMSKDMAKEIAEGKVIKADTIQDLAKAIDVNASNLESTIKKWNDDMASTGKDSVWNTEFGLVPMTTPPYYATKVIEYNLGSLGGVRINVNAQVIDVNGNVIPHLYAGGQTAGGHMGPFYPSTGTGVMSTVFFGRTAAKNAVAETAWES
jgi:fumarate reductase flavoprotein subunit